MHMNRIHTLATTAVAASLLSVTTLAQAQSAGTWLGRIGATSVTPQVRSGELSTPAPPDTRIDVDKSTTLGGGISYMVTDHWSVDLPLALPFENSIRGAGAIAGAGEIGKAKVVPATLFVQYRFGEAQALIRPFVGVGPTYASFYGEEGNGTLTALTNPGGPGTTLKIKDKWGVTAQVGATLTLTPKTYFELMMAKTKLKTRSTLSTGQTIDVRLDPMTLGLYLGYRY